MGKHFDYSLNLLEGLRTKHYVLSKRRRGHPRLEIGILDLTYYSAEVGIT